MASRSPGIRFTRLKETGLETPYTANTANAISYGMSCFMTLFGGPLVNKLGIKWACVIAASAFFLDGSSYYVNSKYGESPDAQRGVLAKLTCG
jgi:hypothetical protein